MKEFLTSRLVQLAIKLIGYIAGPTVVVSTATTDSITQFVAGLVGIVVFFVDIVIHNIRSSSDRSNRPN